MVRLTRRGQMLVNTLLGLYVVAGFIVGMSVTQAKDSEMMPAYVWLFALPIMAELYLWAEERK